MIEIDNLVWKDLTGVVIGGFYTVYNTLGYGFSEHVHSNALTFELRRRGLTVQREVPVQVFYAGEPIALYRMDMVVEGKLLVEIKSSANVAEIERRQIFNYLRATDLPLALLLHFGPKPDVKRFISSKKQFNSQS
jgi:GxxExxY protein